MAAVGKFGALLAFVSIIIIIFYLKPNQDSIDNIRDLSFIVGGAFFLGLLLAIVGGRRHARKHGWIS
ncbi:MAG: hypothetical protein O6761_02005 [Thaumarchaeota archaeon]|nr:hypothetical protein [Nitrososphaerota archaeon]